MNRLVVGLIAVIIGHQIYHFILLRSIFHKVNYIMSAINNEKPIDIYAPSIGIEVKMPNGVVRAYMPDGEMLRIFEEGRETFGFTTSIERIGVYKVSVFSLSPESRMLDSFHVEDNEPKNTGEFVVKITGSSNHLAVKTCNGIQARGYAVEMDCGR